MGLFSFFTNNKKGSFTTDNGIKGPTYFDGYSKHFFASKKLNDNEWRRMLISQSGSTKFRIRHFGRKLSRFNDLIAGTTAGPSIVIAEEAITGERILLYDACRHGYNAMFCDLYTAGQLNGRTVDQLFLDNKKNDIFEVMLSAYYDADFEDECPDDTGLIELADQTKIDFETAKRNAFDGFQIILLNADGKQIEILREETA